MLEYEDDYTWISGLQRETNHVYMKAENEHVSNERGELAASYKWTNWSSRLHEIQPIILKEFVKHIPN